MRAPLYALDCTPLYVQASAPVSHADSYDVQLCSVVVAGWKNWKEGLGSCSYGGLVVSADCPCEEQTWFCVVMCVSCIVCILWCQTLQ